MAGILVTDGVERAALAVVRSLGRAGHRVHVAAGSAPSLSGASRYAASEHLVPDPLREPAGYLRAIRERLEAGDVDVLIPVSDASLLALLPGGSGFDGVAVPFPPDPVFRRASNKLAVVTLARELGIPTPPQEVLSSRAEMEDRERLALPDFPVVVKPSRSVAEGPSGRIELGVRHADTPEALREALAHYPPGAYPLLIQRRIRGPGVGVFVLRWDGEILAAFAHRRLREVPPSGGVSVLRESVALESGPLDASLRLLEALEWKGVAMVEYKLDVETGAHVLMEVNGRFWGSLQLAVDAGVDFPALLVRAALGEPPAPRPAYRAGVRCRWCWGEVDHLLGLLRGARNGGSPGAAWTVPAGALLGWLRPAKCEVLRLRDPGPFLRETRSWLRHVRSSATAGPPGGSGEATRR